MSRRSRRSIASLRYLPVSFIALVAIGLAVLAGCQMIEAEPAPSYRLYVGTATGDAEEGIHTFAFDRETGALVSEHEVVSTLNPSYLTLSPDGRYLYSVSETAEGSVSAYRVDPASGVLEFLNEQSVRGAGPAYVSTDTSGRWVLAANYGSGSITLFPVADDGSLGEAVQVVQHTGSGPDSDRQEGPHAHYVHVDPQNRYAFAADLGIDEVRAYPFDAEGGRLDEQNAGAYVAPPGTGPRHLDFHPNGRYTYLLGELNGTVTVLEYDADTGAMEAVQTVSTLSEGFDGSNKSADVHVHPSGRYLYASNRGDADDIAVFTIDDSTGRLTPAGRQSEGIDWPRNFAIDPTGTFLVVANRNAGEIAVFRIDAETGALTPTGHTASVSEPTVIKFAAP